MTITSVILIRLYILPKVKQLNHKPNTVQILEVITRTFQMKNIEIFMQI